MRRTPASPLTLRGMHRPRHRPRSSARISFPLLAALAALMLVCVPAFAQADSVEKQYETELPEAGIPEKKQKQPKTEKESEATTSNGMPKTGPSEETGDDKGSEEESEKQGVAAGTNGNGNGGGSSGKGSPGGGNANGSQGTGSVAQGEAVPGTESGEQVAHSTGGSTSPLVPILIAVAVLAAISIGAVIYRQRRQDSGGSGSAVSPNA
jgi:cobalamin biosynthesis Mg chelatase CobN